jgi:hypothetical protein
MLTPDQAARLASFSYPPHVTDASNYAWRERDWRRPSLPDGEVVVFDEPGRVLPDARTGGGTCCRSHHFVVSTAATGGMPMLRVRHGGGQRCWPLSWDPRLIEALAALDSDQRFRMLWTLAAAHEESYRKGAAESAERYEAAFVQGRLRKRKIRGTGRYRVTITVPLPTPARASA